MSNKNSNTTRLGFFVIATFLIFTIAIYKIGTKQNMFGSTFRVNATFKNVNGLQTGNNVRYSGINVGTVYDIVIINDTTIRVDLNLDKSLEGVIKENATAKIGGDGLVGNKVVNITPGSGVANVVHEHATISSMSGIDTDDVINSLGETTDNISLLTIRLLEVAENLANGEGSLPRLINDSDLADDLQSAVQNLRTTSENLNHLSGELDKNIKGAQKGDGVLGYLLTDTTLAFQMNQITANLDNLIQNRTEPIMDNLETASQEISSTSTALRSLVENIDLENGLIGAVLNDTLMKKDFEQTMGQLKESSFRLNENLEALKHNFLFRGYFKKQAKAARKGEN